MKLFVGHQFSWDIEECIPRFFQATGTCEAPPDDPDECHKNGDCPTQTIITVMACDVEDACKQIKSKLKNFKLEKLVRFKKPALGRDSQDSNEDPTCNEDVTPTPDDCIECCDLLGVATPPPSSESSSLEFEEESSLELASFSSFPLRSQQLIDDDEGDTEEPSLTEVNSYVYYGTGYITLEGGAAIDSDDLGEIPIEMTFSEEITDDQMLEVFVPVPTLPLPQAVSTVQLDCCPAQFTLAMELRHTLNRIKPFAAFLKTNNLTLPGIIAQGNTNPNFIKLNYSARNGQWQGNLHFSGQSVLGNFNELWDFGFQFGCEGSNWKFSLSVANTQPSKRYLSRMLVYYKLDTVCPLSDVFFGFKFSIDVAQLTSSPAPAQSIVVNDDGGFFRNLQLAFRVLPQNRGSGSRQTLADNSAAYDDTLTGGEE